MAGNSAAAKSPTFQLQKAAGKKGSAPTIHITTEWLRFVYIKLDQLAALQLPGPSEGECRSQPRGALTYWTSNNRHFEGNLCTTLFPPGEWHVEVDQQGGVASLNCASTPAVPAQRVDALLRLLRAWPDDVLSAIVDLEDRDEL